VWGLQPVLPQDTNSTTQRACVVRNWVRADREMWVRLDSLPTQFRPRGALFDEKQLLKRTGLVVM